MAGERELFVWLWLSLVRGSERRLRRAETTSAAMSETDAVMVRRRVVVTQVGIGFSGVGGGWIHQSTAAGAAQRNPVVASGVCDRIATESGWRLTECH